MLNKYLLNYLFNYCFSASSRLRKFLAPEQTPSHLVVPRYLHKYLFACTIDDWTRNLTSQYVWPTTAQNTNINYHFYHNLRLLDISLHRAPSLRAVSYHVVLY